MSKKVTIQIHSDNCSIDVVTESEVTQHLLNRLEQNVDAILNRHIAHDMRGRLASINLSLSMLERHITDDGHTCMQKLKLQVEDLSRLVDVL